MVCETVGYSSLTIEILKKEIERLNILLQQSSAKEFEQLKKEMEKEVAELRECKKRYEKLIEETIELKVDLERELKRAH